MPLDTHTAFKQLTAAGFTEGQAEVVASLMRGAGEVDLSGLATKEDVAACATRVELAELRTETKMGFLEMKASFAENLGLIRSDILKWTMGALGLQVFAVIAAMVGIVRMMR